VGVALGLPLLESMSPALASVAGKKAAAPASATPRRLLAICNNLGLLNEHYVPEGAGRDYKPSPYLALLQAHREDFTALSGVCHPNVDGAHASDICFLTAAPHPGSGSFRNTISLDQHIAEQIGPLTRFPSMTLAVNSRTRSLSWTGSGVAIPPEDRAAEVFRQLFFQGTASEIEAQVRKLDTGRSILDTVAAQARRLEANVGPRDRDRLDQYFTSVRDLEQRLKASRGWEQKPKPVPKGPAPVDPEGSETFFEKIEVMYDVARLALETDSTRVITLMLNSLDTPVIERPDLKMTEDYHSLSHHGKSEEKRAQLRRLDELHMKLLAKLIGDFKASAEGGASLLDSTMILYGTNFGDANTHVTTNSPAILAGGGFRHGQHLQWSKVQNYPLPNLFVSILQRFGLEEERFASSTGPMKGLEMI
jgi:hypothetical protein